MNKQEKNKIIELALPLSEYHPIIFKDFKEAINSLTVEDKNKCDTCWHKYRPKKLFTVKDDKP